MRRALTAEIDYSIDLVDLLEATPDRYPYLLESAASGGQLGSCDLLFAFPESQLQLDAGYLGAGGMRNDFLELLDARWSASSAARSADSGLPFAGGWFLLLGYELAQQIEPCLALPTDPRAPIALATRVPAAVIRDRRAERAWIVCEPGREELVDVIARDVARAGPPQTDAWQGAMLKEPDPAIFIAAVARAQQYITAGDIFQANLSRCWTGRLAANATPAGVYRRLRSTNPAPFGGLAVHGELAVVSSSPERLLRAGAGRIETRPIAGTRPRDAAGDAQRIEELMTSPKERAEHVMLIDLERNDLGRICKPGSVMVDEFMTVESYEHVHHIVSNVSGLLRDDTMPGDMIRAVFPGGTITGCPKVRCMEIIAELEARPRGFYTGAMGYLGHDGSLDLNILIRTITMIDAEVSVATGSGIVADSDPQAELEETRAKARGMLLALQGDG